MDGTLLTQRAGKLAFEVCFGKVGDRAVVSRAADGVGDFSIHLLRALTSNPVGVTHAVAALPLPFIRQAAVAAVCTATVGAQPRITRWHPRPRRGCCGSATGFAAALGAGARAGGTEGRRVRAGFVDAAIPDVAVVRVGPPVVGNSAVLTQAAVIGFDRARGNRNRAAGAVDAGRSAAVLGRLTAEERALYDDLRDNRIRLGLRLEHEHIGFQWLAHRLYLLDGTGASNSVVLL